LEIDALIAGLAVFRRRLIHNQFLVYLRRLLRLGLRDAGNPGGRQHHRRADYRAPRTLSEYPALLSFDTAISLASKPAFY
jgi:hypothetical protein